MGPCVALGHRVKSDPGRRREDGGEDAIPNGIRCCPPSPESEGGVEREEIDRVAEPCLRSHPATSEGELYLVVAIRNASQRGVLPGSHVDARYCRCSRNDEEYCCIVASSIVNGQLTPCLRTRSQQPRAIGQATRRLQSFTQVPFQTAKPLVA